MDHNTPWPYNTLENWCVCHILTEGGTVYDRKWYNSVLGNPRNGVMCFWHNTHDKWVKIIHWEPILVK